MAAIKSYTTIEQSKKLVELGLSFSTADMCYSRELYLGESEYPVVIAEGFKVDWTKALPCWSLAALLGVLPEYNLQRTDLGNGKIEYKIVVTTDEDNYASKNYDNPLDACYEMVLKLNELNLL